MMQQQCAFESQFSQHADKARATYTKIDNCLDKMLKEYEAAESSIADGVEPSEALEKLNEQLLTQKPIKTAREHFLHYYRKMSNLNRRIHARESKGQPSPRHSRKRNSEGNPQPKSKSPKDQRFSKFISSMLRGKEERECLKRLLVEHMLREGHWEQAGVFRDLQKEIDPNELFRQCFALKEGIRSGQMEDAIRWCETQRLFQTHQILLEYQLKKAHIIGLVHNSKTPEALTYYAQNMGKFHQHKQQQIQMLVVCVLSIGQSEWFSKIRENKHFDEVIKKRYKGFEYSERVCKQLAEEFGRHYLRHNNLSQFDTFKIIYEVSGSTKAEFKRLMDLMNQSPKQQQDDSVLPFSVSVPKDNQYHSLFLCPITKEVHSSGEKSMVLSCGHLISQGAHVRIVHENRNRRRVKCPICLKQIKPEDSVSAEF